MTKAEIVDRITETTGLAKRDVAVVVDRFLDAVGRALSAGNHIEIRGFGSFKVKSRRARIARNPRTGARVEVPEKLVPYFKVSKELKKLIEEADPTLDNSLTAPVNAGSADGEERGAGGHATPASRNP